MLALGSDLDVASRRPDVCLTSKTATKGSLRTSVL